MCWTMLLNLLVPEVVWLPKAWITLVFPGGDTRVFASFRKWHWQTSWSQWLWVWQRQVSWLVCSCKWFQKLLVPFRAYTNFLFSSNDVKHKVANTLTMEEADFDVDLIINFYWNIQYSSVTWTDKYHIQYFIYLVLEEQKLKEGIDFAFCNGLDTAPKSDDDSDSEDGTILKMNHRAVVINQERHYYQSSLKRSENYMTETSLV